MTEPLFGPDSMMWKVNRESVLLLGARPALLMQLAHPLVAAGVADHSEFRADGAARLKRTFDAMFDIIFGDRETAHRVARRINHIHTRVKGTAPDGRPYDATDPELLLWVFATLIDSSVRVYEACLDRLSDEEIARFYDESGVVATLFGIPADVLPPSLSDLRAWMRERIATGDVVVTPLARELAEPIIRPVPWVPRRLAVASSFVMAALLPQPVRDGYGLKLWWPTPAVLAVGRRASKAMLPRLPDAVRTFPVAKVGMRLIA